MYEKTRLLDLSKRTMIINKRWKKKDCNYYMANCLANCVLAINDAKICLNKNFKHYEKE